MCRWLAYLGTPIYLDELLFKPEHSLIRQSLRARHSTVTINGDGFGVGWYGERAEPGLYRDLQPAWNDANLRSLAEQIRTRLFFAHVRASTGTSVSRDNCHPFRHGRWMFMHNGQIGGFDRIARDLDFAIAPELYRARKGTTDSETLFYLMLTHGLDQDPAGAMGRTVALVQRTMAAAGIEAPLRLTAALTDGQRIYALRHSSDNAAPTLFYGYSGDIARAGLLRMDHDDEKDSLMVLSEPLDDVDSHWSAVEEGSLVEVSGGKVRQTPFRVPA